MSRLKNITPGSISIRMFSVASPQVNFVSQNVLLTLTPGEDINEALWLVSDISDPSYNSDIISGYISNNILTRI